MCCLKQADNNQQQMVIHLMHIGIKSLLGGKLMQGYFDVKSQHCYTPYDKQQF